MASPGVYFNTIDNSQYLISDNPAQYAIVGPTVKGIPYIPTIVKGYNDFTSKFGDSFTISGSNTSTEYLTSIAVKNFYDSADSTVPLLVTRIISGAYVSGSGLNSSVLSTYAKSDVPVSGSTALSYTSSFTLETITWGDSVNNNTGSYISGSLIQNGKGFKWSITSQSNASNSNPNGLFNITITNNFGDNTQTSFLNLTLDPNDPNNNATYIGKALGDIKYILNQDTSNNYLYNNYWKLWDYKSIY